MLKNRLGVSQTPFLIVFIILTFLSTLGAYMFSSKLEDQKSHTVSAKRRSLQWERRFNGKWNEVRNLRNVLGYFTSDSDPEATQTDATIVSGELDRIKASVLPQEPVASPLTVKSMLGKLEEALNKLKKDYTVLAVEGDNLRQNVLSEEISRREMLEEKNKEIRELRERTRKNIEQLNLSLLQKEGQITELRDRNHSLRSNFERVEVERSGSVTDLSGKVKRLEGRLDSVIEKQKRAITCIPDGEVIRADIDHGYAYIDIGWKHRVAPGSRFNVYSVRKGGRREIKGEIRIIRTEKDFSQCAILKVVDREDPIVRGDHVFSRFFEAGVSKSFVFLGKFGAAGGRYSEEQLRRIVLENGHTVSEYVRADTDFALIGDDYKADEKKWSAVKDFRVQLIPAKELVRSIGFGKFK
jgi:hypothetical protein